MISDIEYHLQRARSERHIAYCSPDACVSDRHMRLSALHLSRTLLLQEVRCSPVGNISPLSRNLTGTRGQQAVRRRFG